MMVGWFHRPVALPQPLGLVGTTPTLPSASPKPQGPIFAATLMPAGAASAAAGLPIRARTVQALNCPRRMAAPQGPLPHQPLWHPQRCGILNAQRCATSTASALSPKAETPGNGG